MFHVFLTTFRSIFTFYSKINDSTSSNVVGCYGSDDISLRNAENIENGKLENSTFFLQDRRSDFFDHYVEIGKWSQTYNPATSGIEEGTLSQGIPVP